MTYEPQRHHRRSIRLRGYDYAQAGAYFVTVCVQDRACLLGEVVGGEVSVSRAGQVIEAGWLDLPRRFPGIDIDAFVVMPNHVHGIVVLGTIPEIGIESVTPPWEEGAMNRAPTQEVGRNRASAADHAGQSSAAPEGNASGVGAR